jgi:hypothetical protein
MNILKNAFLNSFGATAYIAAVASFLFYGVKNLGPDDTLLVPIMMLMLLVLSVAVMAVLIFGRPVLWYLDGNKKEAISLLVSTLLIFFLTTLIVFLSLYFISL